MSTKLKLKPFIKKKKIRRKNSAIKRKTGRIVPSSILASVSKKLRYWPQKSIQSENRSFVDLDTVRQSLDKSNLKSWLEYGVCPLDMQLDADQFDSLWNERPSEYPVINMYGKNIKSPRLVKNYLLKYKYSGTTINPESETPQVLLNLLNCANMMEIDGKDYNFNQILVNWYEDGDKYISLHSDNEPELVKNSPILSLSFGATRRFRLKKNSDGEQDTVVELKNNTFVIMGGTCQTTHKHEVLKEPKCKEKRINITFRNFNQ